MNETIVKRQKVKKELLLEKLRKTPIVQVACQKAGVGRATYYRWRKKDPKFAREANVALEEGASLINDMAESQLLSAIRDQNMTAIIFWLKHHHSTYATKVEITSSNKHIVEELTPEQEIVVRKALELAALIPEKKDEKK